MRDHVLVGVVVTPTGWLGCLCGGMAGGNLWVHPLSEALYSQEKKEPAGRQE